MEGLGEPIYRVLRPVLGIPLFRLAAADEAKAFVANRDLPKERMPREDALLYRGISAHISEAHARDLSNRLGAPRRLGDPPRWSFILVFRPDSDRGHVIADTLSPGHLTVWGEPQELYSTVIKTIPI